MQSTTPLLAVKYRLIACYTVHAF